MTLPCPANPALTPHLFALHAASDTEALWASARELLYEAFAPARVTLFLGHLEMGDARLVFTDPPLERPAEWFAARGKLNPFSPWIETHRGAPHYLFHEVVGPPEVFRQTEFYRQFAEPEGWDTGLSCLFWERGHVRAMFSVYRAPGAPAFGPPELAILGELRPHFEVALDKIEQLHRERARRTAFEGFVRQLPLPLVLLDWAGQTVFANLEGREAAAVWNFGEREARRRNPRDCYRLPAPVAATVQALRAEILAAEPKQLARQMPRPRTAQAPAGEPRRATVLPLPGATGTITEPGFLVVFQEPGPRPAAAPAENPPEPGAAPLPPAPAHLPELARLSPAEREVARRVAEGASNAEIARALGKSVLTIKTQLRAVFAKLEVASRGKLAARLRG